METEHVQRKDSFSFNSRARDWGKGKTGCSDRIASGVTIYGKYTERRELERRVRNRNRKEKLYYIDGLISNKYIYAHEDRNNRPIITGQY